MKMGGVFANITSYRMTIQVDKLLCLGWDNPLASYALLARHLSQVDRALVTTTLSLVYICYWIVLWYSFLLPWAMLIQVLDVQYNNVSGSITCVWEKANKKTLINFCRSHISNKQKYFLFQNFTIDYVQFQVLLYNYEEMQVWNHWLIFAGKSYFKQTKILSFSKFHNYINVQFQVWLSLITFSFTHNVLDNECKRYVFCNSTHSTIVIIQLVQKLTAQGGGDTQVDMAYRVLERVLFKRCFSKLPNCFSPQKICPKFAGGGGAWCLLSFFLHVRIVTCYNFNFQEHLFCVNSHYQI